MLSLSQYLLIKLSEECNELAQRALKAAQFGMEEIQTGQDLSNAERMNDEFNDVLAVVHLLNCHADDVMLRPDVDKQNRKMEKVRQYLQLSRAEGQVEP